MSDASGPKFWRHKRRNTVYERIGGAEVQASEPIREGDVVTVYRDREGKLWVRPVTEFYDGRFEPVTDGDPRERVVCPDRS